MTLLAAENLGVYWEVPPLGTAACQCLLWAGVHAGTRALAVSNGYHLPQSGHSIPSDVIHSGACFYGSTTQCIDDDIGEDCF